QKVLGISGEPQVVGITRWERAIPQYNLGHRDRVQRVTALLNTVPGLHLIGNYLHGVSTGDVIKEADRVARDVTRRHRLEALKAGQRESRDFRRTIFSLPANLRATGKHPNLLE